MGAETQLQMAIPRLSRAIAPYSMYPFNPPIPTRQDGHQHIRAKTTAAPFPTEGSPLHFCFPEWLGFALMLPPLLLQETQAWVRPLNLPCMTMLQSSRPTSAAT
jgi:hypothetical protein